MHTLYAKYATGALLYYKIEWPELGHTLQHNPSLSIQLCQNQQPTAATPGATALSTDISASAIPSAVASLLLVLLLLLLMLLLLLLLLLLLMLIWMIPNPTLKLHILCITLQNVFFQQENIFWKKLVPKNSRKGARPTSSMARGIIPAFRTNSAKEGLLHLAL